VTPFFSLPSFSVLFVSLYTVSSVSPRASVADAATAGGRVDSFGDHRIAMMAAVASIGCTDEVVIHGAEAVNKSYPGFWADFNALGGHAELSEEA